MDRHLRFAMTSLLTAMLLAAPARAETTGPEATMAAFLKLYPEIRQEGLPAGPVLERVRPLLSARLTALLVAVDKADKRMLTVDPDWHPWGGDVWVSSGEGATAHKMGNCHTKGGRSVCRIFFAYEFNGTIRRWHDDFVLISQSSNWVIDDVLWRDASVANCQSLRQELLGGLQVLRNAHRVKTKYIDVVLRCG
jgi:hypothetical protein